MDIQTELSKIKKDINGGRLDSALTLIKNLPDDNYKNQIYVNIFSCICMFVAQNNYNPKKTISVPQLKEILFIIKEEIKEPQEKIVINYLRSLYHTLRFLVKKVSLLLYSNVRYLVFMKNIVIFKIITVLFLF